MAVPLGSGESVEPVELRGFDWNPRTRVVFGAGTLARLGELAAGTGGRRVLVVTDPGIVAAGHVERAEESLRAAGLEVRRFDQARENPTTRDVARCLDAARAAGADLLVGLGGGSSLDVAKGCNFLLTGGGRMQDYWGIGKATRPMLPLIAVPTTAGTGSELQSFALIADEETHQKMACGDPKAAPRVALLDPELTLTQPPLVTACTGLDAIGHAVECAVTTRRTPVSDLFARAAFRLAHGAFPRVLADPDDLAARGAMLKAAAFAGIAIENSMLGAAHSLANPLTARFGVAHGQAVAMMLPHVVRFNAEEPSARRVYASLAAAAEGSAESDDPGAAAELAARLAAGLGSHLRTAGLPTSLADVGVEADAVTGLAEEASRQWTAQFNPRSVGAEDFRHLYEAARA